MFNFINQYSGNEALLALAAFIIAILAAITLHEFAHAYAAYRQGDNTAKAYGRMTVNPLAHLDPFGTIMLLLVGFGWAKPVPTNPMNYKEYKKGLFIVSIAGIVVNLVLFLMFTGYLVFFNNFFPTDTNSLIFFVRHLLIYVSQINLFLAIFNLLPIAPLDGFNILTAFSRGSNKVIEFLRDNGFIILLLLLITGILRRIIIIVYSAVSSPVISFFELFI